MIRTPRPSQSRRAHRARSAPVVLAFALGGLSGGALVAALGDDGASTSAHDGHELAKVATTLGGGGTDVPASTAPLRLGDGDEELGSFRLECTLSHRKQVDPIVDPGPDARSHHVHDFFGNASTDSYSTYRSMVTSTSTCGFRADTAAYWVPSLLDDRGEFVEPERMIIYYRNRPSSYGTTNAFPPDFRMIAGGVDTYPHAYWNCDGQSDGALESRAKTPPDCGQEELKLQIFFPSCWDGVNLDSDDHRSHVAYAFDAADGSSTDISDNTCPESHPVKLPQLHVRVLYPTSNGGRVELSDGTLEPHGDFWNTWHQDTLEELTEDCLRAGASCDRLTD